MTKTNTLWQDGNHPLQLNKLEMAISLKVRHLVLDAIIVIIRQKRKKNTKKNVNFKLKNCITNSAKINSLLANTTCLRKKILNSLVLVTTTMTPPTLSLFTNV